MKLTAVVFSEPLALFYNVCSVTSPENSSITCNYWIQCSGITI